MDNQVETIVPTQESQPVPLPTVEPAPEATQEISVSPETVQELPVDAKPEEPIVQPQPEPTSEIVEPVTPIEEPKKEEKRAEEPTDKNLDLKLKFLEYMRDLPVQKLAAGWIAKHEDTITDWKREDPWFSDQIEIAKSEWAKKTSRGVKSKEWLLERVMKDHFAERKELTGKDGKDLPVPIMQLDVSGNDSNTENKVTE